MGKGDRKSKRGKLFKGSYGKSRPRKPEHNAAVPAPAESKPKTKTKSKAKKETAS